MESVIMKKEFQSAAVIDLTDEQKEILEKVENFKRNIITKNWLKSMMDIEEISKDVGRVLEIETE